MANAFLKPEKVVNQGLGMLMRELVLARIVSRKGVADFKGAKNDTISIKIPSLLAAREYEWRTRTAPIEIDDLVEQSIPLLLNKHLYSAVQITDEELTLDITSWGEDVARPQVRAVAEKAEASIATAMDAGDYQTELQFVEGLEGPDGEPLRFWHTLTAARKALNTQFVPANNRWVVLGANVEEAFLNEPGERKVDESGTDSALRDAVIDRRAGFTVIGNCNSIDPDVAYAFHPTAYAFGNVAPVVPDGVARGATSSYEGIAMRWIQDYDSMFLRNRSIYSLFSGAWSIEDGRVMDPDDPDFAELTGKNVRAVKITFDSVTSG